MKVVQQDSFMLNKDFKVKTCRNPLTLKWEWEWLSGDMYHTENVTAKLVEEVRLTYKGVASLRQIWIRPKNSAWPKKPFYFYATVWL